LLEIVRVPPGSAAADLGLRSGDFIVSINNEEVNDVIDFQFLAADEHLTLVVKRKGGKTEHVRTRKDPDDNLGLEFPPLHIKRCRNNCIFCFVDQMPSGSRKTLYIKDDDFRASFLYGNFITLGALSESDWDRIFRQRLSPLYISVHATDPELRSLLLRNKKAPDIISSLKRLAAGGIRMHTQIVLCPGVNDGEHLERTINDLAALFPAVASIAVVPVGRTAFREGLFPLRSFTQREARRVLETTRTLARRFNKQFGTRLVFPSDEFFIKAQEAIPSSSFYEDFPQIENGVGMIAAFLSEVSRTRLPSRMPDVTATVITGVSFSGVLDTVLARIRTIDGVTIRKVAVKNRFFGPSVTVTGLLTGSDILHALKGKRLGDILMIPSNALKEDEAVFLDGMSLEQLQQQLKVRAVSVDGFRDMLDKLLIGGGRKG
jgi:putative radical SAM enzyme (TIGR03279 family)